MIKTIPRIIEQYRLAKAKNIIALLQKPVVSIPILGNVFGVTMPVISICLNDNLMERQEKIHYISTHAFLGFKEESSPLEFISDYSLEGCIFLVHILARDNCYACTRMATKAAVPCLKPACLTLEEVAADLTCSYRHGSASRSAWGTAVDLLPMTPFNLKGLPALRAYFSDTVTPRKASTPWTAVRTGGILKARGEDSKSFTANLASVLNTQGFH